MKRHSRMISQATILTMALLVTASRAGLIDDMGLDSEASRLVREQTYKPRGVQQPPAQHSSAEGLPPLPLPVVPLRRTEKKNPPRPPVLIAKLANDDRNDWAISPEDADKLLKFLSKNMKVDFSTMELHENNIPEDASQIPVLYRSGVKAFSFSDTQRQRLRNYLLNGGTLILNAYCGHPDFARSALQEMQKLIPERPPYRLAGDHPLYRSCYDIKDIRYRPLAHKTGAKNGIPSEIGIDINTRTAVFFFRYDLSTAWDGLSSDAMHIIGYEPDTAQQIGANLMAYVTAERSAGVPLSQALLFQDADQGRSGKLSVAQAQYQGLWQARDNSLPMLLNVFHQQTKTPVQFAQNAIELSSSRIYEHPLVYLTGTQAFELSEAECTNLRSYLQRGGTLFIEAACGRQSFNDAIRRNLAAILPGTDLAPLPENHLIFQYPHRLSRVRPRPALAQLLDVSGTMKPVLMGTNVNGRLAVIYSPYDLSSGWALAAAPYDYGIVQEDALALGVNVLSFALMQ